MWAGAKSPSSLLLGFNLSLNRLILIHLSNLNDMASSNLAHAAFLQADEGLNTPPFGAEQQEERSRLQLIELLI